MIVPKHLRQMVSKTRHYHFKNINKEGTRLDYLSDKVTSQNTTGVRGVSYRSKNGKYRAYIYFKNKRIELGEYTKLEDAAKARKNAEEIYYKPILEKYNKIDKLNNENEEEFE